MNKLITEEQFEKALNISTKCARKKWQHSTDMIIAKVIGLSENKEETITQIEKIVDETEVEEKALSQIKEQFTIILKQEK